MFSPFKTLILSKYKYVLFQLFCLLVLFKLLRNQWIYAAKRYNSLSALSHLFQSFYFINNFKHEAVKCI